MRFVHTFEHVQCSQNRPLRFRTGPLICASVGGWLGARSRQPSKPVKTTPVGLVAPLALRKNVGSSPPRQEDPADEGSSALEPPSFRRLFTAGRLPEHGCTRVALRTRARGREISS